MFKEILYVNNIADLFDISEAEAQLMSTTLSDYVNTYSSLYGWFNIGFVNNLLSDFFALIESIKGDKQALFFALIFNYLGTHKLTSFDILDLYFKTNTSYINYNKELINRVIYYLDLYEYQPNDLNIYEQDFILFLDLYLYYVPVTLESNALAFMKDNTIIFLRPKGSNLTYTIEEALHLLIDRSSFISTPILKESYLHKVKYLISIQDRLQVK